MNRQRLYSSVDLIEEGYPNGKEAVLKTAERKLLQVRVLSPPPIHSKESPVFLCITTSFPVMKGLL